jgi:dethiobiotin synthetase/adenosylmethionine--8-amino-7-oxononanoate aminotransferase
MVDPLFQRVLVNECRNKRIPVIFDEVFTGFWRVGTEVGCPLETFNSFFFSFLNF